MLLLEIIGSPRNVFATDFFRKSLSQLQKNNPNINKTIYEFLEFRRIHRPDEPYAAKDLAFQSGTPLTGYRHFHLIFGKNILIYRMFNQDILLYMIVKHEDFEGRNAARLRTQLDSIQIKSFTIFDPEQLIDHKTVKISPETLEEMRNLLYEFAAEDREILIAATKGDLEPLLEYLRLVVEEPLSDDQKDNAIIVGFGGEENLIKIVVDVLRQTAHNDSFTMAEGRN